MSKRYGDAIRVDKNFKKMLKDIKIAKIKNGTASSMLSDERITRAISRVPKLKDLVIKSPLIREEELK